MINTVKKINLDGVFSNSYLLTLENGNTLYVPKDEANTDYQNILQVVHVASNVSGTVGQAGESVAVASGAYIAFKAEL